MIYNKLANYRGRGYDWLWTKKKVHEELKQLSESKFRKIAETYPLTMEQKEAIDDFFMTNYGEKIPYPQRFPKIVIKY